MLFDPENLKNIKLLALKSVLKPDEEYICRKLCRWYSKNYNTPIDEVEKIPIENLLQHYYEVEYEYLAEDPEHKEALDKIKTELTETDQEKKKRLDKETKEEIDEYAWLQKVADRIVEKEKTSLDNVKKDKEKENLIRELEQQKLPEISMKFDESVDELELKENKKDKGFGLLAPSKK